MKNSRIIFLLIILVILVLTFGLKFSGRSQSVIIKQIFATPTPTPFPDKTITMDSGDGKVALTQTIKTQVGGNTNNLFTVTDKSNNNQTSLYEKTESYPNTLTIPANSWSSDNKQLFLIEKGTETHYYVFKADNTNYSGDQKFLDIGSYWAKSKINYTIRNVTGWASGDLLYIYTSKADGSNGPQYWFVVSSRKFLQLRPGP